MPWVAFICGMMVGGALMALVVGILHMIPREEEKEPEDWGPG